MRVLPPIHSDEFHITIELVRCLIKANTPSLCQLSLRPIIPGGTDHLMVRIGESYVARLPRHPRAISGLEVERKWLPLLAPALSIKIPQLVHSGDQSDQYPAPWSMLSWLPGNAATPVQSDASFLKPDSLLPQKLGQFIKELRSFEVPSQISKSELPESYRTKSLHERDSVLNSALNQCDDVFDRPRVLEAWNADKSAGGEWSGPPVAVHGDLQPSNIIISDDKQSLAGVIDWSMFSFGDPAVDLLPAWMLFDQNARLSFRSACDVDENTWRRGRAWALSIGIIAFPYYRHSRPDHAAVSRRQVEQVLAEIQDEAKA